MVGRFWKRPLYRHHLSSASAPTSSVPAPKVSMAQGRWQHSSLLSSTPAPLSLGLQSVPSPITGNRRKKSAPQWQARPAIFTAGKGLKPQSPERLLQSSGNWQKETGSLSLWPSHLGVQMLGRLGQRDPQTPEVGEQCNVQSGAGSSSLWYTNTLFQDLPGSGWNLIYSTSPPAPRNV